MPEHVSIKQSEVTAHETNDLIAGKSLEFYWKTSRLFIAVLVVLEIINIIFEVYVYGHWIIEVVIFILFTAWLLKRWRVKLTTAIMGCVILGIIAGLLLAIFDIIWYHQWWYLLNLIRKPFLVGLVGLITTFIFYFSFRSFKTKKTSKGLGPPGRPGHSSLTNDSKKGGGMYG